MANPKIDLQYRNASGKKLPSISGYYAPGSHSPGDWSYFASTKKYKTVKDAVAAAKEQMPDFEWIGRIDHSRKNPKSFSVSSKTSLPNVDFFKRFPVTYTQTYTIVTEESAEQGEAEDHGFIFRHQDYSALDLWGKEAADLKKEVTQTVEDMSDIRRALRDVSGVYVNRECLREEESSQDYRTGDYRGESVHFSVPKAGEATLIRMIKEIL